MFFSCSSGIIVPIAGGARLMIIESEAGGCCYNRRNRMTLPNSNSTAAAWDSNLLANPHAVSDKRRRVRQMFAAIAPSYDLNNRLHSLWMDQHWRNKAVELAQLRPMDTVVDVACGTGDLTLKFAEKLAAMNGGSLRCGQVVGVDFTFEMLPLAKGKAVARLSGENHQCPIWIAGDAQSLPLPDACCDVVSIAFGIRNVADPMAALREFRRILRPGGRLIILEFSLPTSRLLRALYNFYFRKILPRTATVISGDKTGAYKYLPESVNTFISRERMAEIVERAGFSAVRQHVMTLGACVAYFGEVQRSSNGCR
jgi:demethylmenaquinone methyltransferase/2-methoxy-6-polyprenyl-1,4-benzoquinol methylase